MNVTTINTTDRVLAAMLTENTGRHFLDSGGAYGRSWERNQAAAGDDPVAYFMARPDISMDRYDCVNVDVFHYLRQRVTYAPTLDRVWRMWCRQGDNDTYFNSAGTVEEFCEALVGKEWANWSEWGRAVENTYNVENPLSQDFMWTFLQVEYGDALERLGVDPGEYVAISIHGGCDARGGYTDFRWFEITGYDGVYDFLNWNDYQIGYKCDGSHDHDPNQLTLDGSPSYRCPFGPLGDDDIFLRGYSEWYTSLGDYLSTKLAEYKPADDVADGYDGPSRFVCPECDGVLALSWMQAPHTS